MARTLTSRPHYKTSSASALPGVLLAEPDDISNGVIYLSPDLSRAVTGTQLTIDMRATKV